MFSVFVTVGSTFFDELVEEICQSETLSVLLQEGYDKLTIQIGKGRLPKSLVALSEDSSDEEEILDSYNKAIKVLDSLKEVKLDLLIDDKPLHVVVFRYLPSILSLMAESDLIISHAGAGTCLDALGLGKTQITVVNDRLMDQHQSELAEKFASLQFSHCCEPATLVKTVRSLNEKTLNEYEPGKPQLFDKYMRSIFAFDAGN